jgi:hypothetical protein
VAGRGSRGRRALTAPLVVAGLLALAAGQAHAYTYTVTYDGNATEHILASFNCQRASADFNGQCFTGRATGDLNDFKWHVVWRDVPSVTPSTVKPSEASASGALAVTGTRIDEQQDQHEVNCVVSPLSANPDPPPAFSLIGAPDETVINVGVPQVTGFDVSQDCAYAPPLPVATLDYYTWGALVVPISRQLTGHPITFPVGSAYAGAEPVQADCLEELHYNDSNAQSCNRTVNWKGTITVRVVCPDTTVTSVSDPEGNELTQAQRDAVGISDDRVDAGGTLVHTGNKAVVVTFSDGTTATIGAHSQVPITDRVCKANNSAPRDAAVRPAAALRSPRLGLELKSGRMALHTAAGRHPFVGLSAGPAVISLNGSSLATFDRQAHSTLAHLISGAGSARRGKTTVKFVRGKSTLIPDHGSIHSTSRWPAADQQLTR